MIQPRVPLNGKEFEKFCKGTASGLVDPFFPTQAHLLVFAASIACEVDEFQENPETKSDSIKETVLRNNNLVDRIRIMALYKTNDVKVLDDDYEVSSIVEGYAAAGFEIMKTWLNEAEEENYFFDLCKEKILERCPELPESEEI